MSKRGNQPSKKKSPSPSPAPQTTTPGGPQPTGGAQLPGANAGLNPAGVTMGPPGASKKKGGQAKGKGDEVAEALAKLEQENREKAQAKAQKEAEQKAQKEAEQQRQDIEKRTKQLLPLAQSEVPTLLKSLQDQVALLLQALAQLIAPPTPGAQPLDPQALLAQAQSSWTRLGTWSKITAQLPPIVSYLQPYLQAGQQAMTFAQTLADAAAEVVRRRAEIARLEQRIAGLQPEAAQLNAAEQALQQATAEVALRRAALARAKALVASSLEGEPSGLADTAEDIVGELQDALEQAERQLAQAQQQKQQALTAQQGLAAAQTDLADARTAEAKATTAAGKTHTSVTEDLALNAELEKLAGGPEKLSGLLAHVPDRQDLRLYLQTLGYPLLSLCLSDKQVKAKLKTIFTEFKVQELKDLVARFKEQELVGLARLFAPADLHMLCDSSNLGLDKLLALVRQFHVNRAHEHIAVDYNGQLNALKALLDIFTAAELAAAEQKLQPGQLIQWHGWFPTCLKPLVLDLPKAHVLTVHNLCTAQSANLTQLVPLLTVPAFVTTVVEVDSATALDVVVGALQPAQIVTVVTALSPKKLGQLLRFQDLHDPALLSGQLLPVCASYQPKLQKLSAADLRRLLLFVQPPGLATLMGKDADTIKELFTAFAQANDTDFQSVLSLGINYIVTMLASPIFKPNWLTVGNVHNFIDLLVTMRLDFDVIDIYDLTWLVHFRGASDTHQHLTVPKVKADGRISGGHEIAAFTQACTTQGYNVQVISDDGVTRKVRYGPPGGWTSTKTLVYGLPGNYQTWKGYANEAIWDAIRRRAFPADGHWVGWDSTGMRFEGFYHKGEDNVATWWPT